MRKPVSEERKRVTTRLGRVNVLDADTIAADIWGRREIIRLRGIDAPESTQSLGKDASNFLKAQLQTTIYARVVERDQYGRLAAWLYQKSNGSRRWTCLNVELVRAGLAYAYRDHGGRHRSIITAEREAKDARRGVWANGVFGDEKPWDYRNASMSARLMNRVSRSVGNWLTRRIQIHG